MRLKLTIVVWLIAALTGSAQMVSPPPATVMFANSGSFAVKVNREPWLRGQAGAATPGWKEVYLQNDANANTALRRTDGAFDFTGVLGPHSATNAAVASYRQTLVSLGSILSLSWQFRVTRAVEMDLIYVSFALPARRFAGKTIRMDQSDITLPERPAPPSERPITRRPQRIVIDSNSLGPVAIRFNRPQVVWIEDLRQSGGDDFEIRILLATGEMKAGDEYFLALQMELAEVPELLVGGPGREFQNDTKSWMSYETLLTTSTNVVSKTEHHPATDASELLHTPAGKFGVLQAKGGHFVWANGERQKFWGLCLGKNAIPDKAKAADAAGRLAVLGVNLVHWAPDALPPDDAGRDAFDAFHAELTRRGIYAHFDLAPAAAAGATRADQRAELIEQAADAWLDRKNHFTGKRYAEDPAIAVVQIPGDDSAATFPASSTPLRREIEAGCFRRVQTHLRGLGVKCPIVTSDPSPAGGDAIGIRSSWDLPRSDRTFSDRAMVTSDGGYLKSFATAAVAHKPLLITGVAHGGHNEYRAEGPMLLAAHAALQDWDGIVWSGDTSDPLIIRQFPTAARLFLGGLMSPSKLRTHWSRNDSEKAVSTQPPLWLTFTSRWRSVLPGIAPSPSDILIVPASDAPPPASDKMAAPAQKPASPSFFGKLWADTAGRIGTSSASADTPIRIVQKPGEDPAVLQKPWVAAARKLGMPLGWEEGGGHEYASDTGQLAWDQDHGQFTIQAPKCCAAVGMIGGKTLSLTDATFDTSAPRFVVISLATLDGEPVAKSHRMLLTAMGRSEHNDQRWLETLDGSLRVLSSKPGIRIEPIHTTVTLRHSGKFKVFPLDVSGQRLKEVPVGLAMDAMAFVLNGESICYELVSESMLPNLWPFGKP